MSGRQHRVPSHMCFTVGGDDRCFECGGAVGAAAYGGRADDLSQDPLANERGSFDADSYYDGDAA